MPACSDGFDNVDGGPECRVYIQMRGVEQVRVGRGLEWRRRAAELEQAGGRIDEAEVLADIQRRDERDSTRAIAPLKAAPDAYLLDTTHLDIDAAFRAAIDIVEAVRAGRNRG